MKQIVVMLFAAIFLMACKSGDKKATSATKTNNGIEVLDEKPLDTANLTSVEWLDSNYLDLGEQKEGKEIEISFRFKNTGTRNLVIENVTAQCGCTVPKKPEEPFAPGEEGTITAKYSGAGHDETRKQIYVSGNIKPSGKDTLTFRALLVK